MKIRLFLSAAILIAAGIGAGILWANYEKQETIVVFSADAAKMLEESSLNIKIVYDIQVKPERTMSDWTFHNASSIDLFIKAFADKKGASVTVLTQEYRNEDNVAIGVEQFFYSIMSDEKKQFVTYSEKYPFPGSSSHWSTKEGSLTSEGVIFIYDNKRKLVGASIFIEVIAFIFSFAVVVSDFKKSSGQKESWRG